VVNDRKVKRVIRETVDKIVASYEPLKIILFGSYTYGDPNPGSDIDLLIVKDTDERHIDRRTTVRKIVSSRTRRVPFEPLVPTQDKLAERIRVGDQFINEILSKGDALYEAG